PRQLLRPGRALAAGDAGGLAGAAQLPRRAAAAGVVRATHGGGPGPCPGALARAGGERSPGGPAGGRELVRDGRVPFFPHSAGSAGAGGPMFSIPDWPAYDERELEAVTRVVRSRKWWRIIGSEVATFEAEFARYQGGEAALAVTNGTQAIELVLQALDIGRG